MRKDDLNMNLRALLTLGFFASALGASLVPVAAQILEPPAYRQWQPAWDQGQFDRRHVILGTIANFKPFRLQVARRDGNIEMIDLKPGTAILPVGETPATNQRVAIIGYYSNCTFIANRVILRD
jgi:hypothetical protein